MSVVVASSTLAELFTGQSIQASDNSLIQGVLHVPEYQRPYCWSGAQLQRLLDELHRYFKPEPGLQPASHQFYLGSIILHQQEVEKEVRLNIIDGQQRLTTLGLLAWLNRSCSEPKLRYSSPESQRQIQLNLLFLKQHYGDDLNWLDLSRINITLVITRREDDAYRFFETQNTGGVRLSGPDIIKAHHLRATARNRQDDYAKLWENLGELTPLVDAVLKARHWHALDL
ncbi:MAG: DUF262 domain-containing protein [Methylomicrobium sp.]